LKGTSSIKDLVVVVVLAEGKWWWKEKISTMCGGAGGNV